MIRAHRIRLNPTHAQEQHFRQAAGTSRAVYNMGLELLKASLEDGKVHSAYELRKIFNHEVKPEKPWIREVNKCVPAMALMDAREALGNFFDSRKGRRKGPRMGFPRFKSKNRSKPSFGIESDKVQLDREKQMIRIPRLGWVQMAEELRYDGRVGNVRISQKAGKWFVSIPVEFDEPVSSVAHRNAAVGIDFGIKTALTLSDGRIFQSPRALAKHLKRLKRASRHRARKVQGSSNRKKAVQKERRLHTRVSDLRLDNLHKASNQITKCHKLIVLENLNLQGMLKNHKLARHLSDGAFGELSRQLKYKSEERGGVCLEVGTFFPSSKTCRKCGTKKTELRLSERVYHCENQACRHEEDRDLNAARNILHEGLRLYRIQDSVEIGRAAPEFTPVERRTAAKLSKESRVSSLAEAGSPSGRRKNQTGYEPPDLYDQV